MVVKAGGGGSTVNTAGALLMFCAEAAILAVPAHTPVAEAPLSVTQLLFVVQVKTIPVIGLLY